MVNRLENKAVIVTGAASGIGETAAKLFAAEGGAVVCADRDGDGAAATAEAAGNGAIGVAVDVSSEADCERMVGEAIDAFGRVDAIYANAGVAGAGTAAEVSLEEWNRVVSINLTGVWLSSKFLLPHMIAQGGGSIVNQASIGGVVGVPGIASYAAAKAGVIGLTKQMAVEYGPRNIRVNAICPGTVPTPLVRATYEVKGGFASTAEADADADFDTLISASLDRYPLGRVGTTTEIAQLALHLASDESSWTTGAIIHIDGGMAAK